MKKRLIKKYNINNSNCSICIDIKKSGNKLTDEKEIFINNLLNIRV